MTQQTMTPDVYTAALNGDREAQLAVMVETLAVHMHAMLAFVSMVNTDELRLSTEQLCTAALECLKAPDVKKEPPLLQCIDCRNTESPAGAMARQFNHGRCLRCGGFFKVIRA